MTTTLTAPTSRAPRDSRATPDCRRQPTAGLALGGYITAAGDAREIVLRPVARGALVIDRDAATLGDARLVAHLEPDEPATNAQLVCRLYLADGCRRCRAVTDQDTQPLESQTAPADGQTPVLVDRAGCRYRLHPVRDERRDQIELRWVQDAAVPGRVAVDPEIVTLRDVVGALEDYEPARELTRAAITAPTGASTCVLAGELRRLDASRIVLNRGLRDAVKHAVAEQHASLSAIATRCGRVKRDAHGTVSGETSWLCRRVGLLPEGGKTQPTPWISSDVLALIARRGLGISPVDVELG
jgi:hypothetical protein